MIETIGTGSSKLVALKLRGKLHDADYKQVEPTMETILTAERKVRLFIQLEDFHGWDLHAAWDHLTFSLRHYSDFERIAMMGDHKWERWSVRLCSLFTHATVKYFEISEVNAAWKWLENTEGTRNAEGADRLTTVCEKPEIWDGYPWFGL